jgi:two-component system KDP operon response regulator KdpE
MKILVIYACFKNPGNILGMLIAGWPDAQILQTAPVRAARIVKKYSPDMVVLDLGNRDGSFILNAIRKISNVPLVVVGEPAGEASIVKALGCGADCYIKKPLGQPELLARFRAIYRRSFPNNNAEIMCQGGITLNKTSNRLSINGDEIHLTNTEKKLLENLINSQGKFISSKELAIKVYGSLPGEDSIKTYIYRLRKKLKSNTHYPELIRNNPGNGYSLSFI